MPRFPDFDPDGLRLPVKIDTTSNGEFMPRPLDPRQRLANRLAHEAADEGAKALGLSRRAFLVSAAGTAATLAACNTANPNAGGAYAIPKEATRDRQLAQATVGGDEFIFDVQTHCVEPTGRWATGADGQRWKTVLERVFGQAAKCTSGNFDCYSAQMLAKEVFLDADTDAAVVSALWGQPNPTPIDYAAEARQIIEATGGDGARCLIHGGVFPQEPGEIEAMDEKAQLYRVAAWKLYPQYGSSGRGIFLDRSDAANRFFERARALGVRTVAVHKGVTLPGLEAQFADPRDMGPAAVANRDINFLVYHSAFEGRVREGPYNPADPQGVDRLIKSHQDAGLQRNQGNLYAELGSTWRHFMSRPDEAAHVIGKLLKYFGEDRIMWGTDSIWYGSPQDQIQAFRTFEISAEYQERFGYPVLTREAKRKIFGLNGARVYGLDAAALRKSGTLQARREAYRAEPNPSFATFGPRTRRQFLALWDARGGVPG
jgi:uncharacterized protein